jgi:large subunit ribosomal protein L19
MAHAVDLIQAIEYQATQQIKDERPDLHPGDTVNVHVRIVEGNRERIQVFQGVVIAIRGGSMNKFFTVRRVAAHGIGVERTFLYYSPRIEKIEVLRHARVRRAKLYYLRSRSGKSARLKEKRFR